MTEKSTVAKIRRKNGKSTEKCMQDLNSRTKTLVQAEWHNIDKAKAELKAMLPMVPIAEVKRFHLPFDQSTIIELEDYGLPVAANYIRDLLNFDEERRLIAGPGTKIWYKAHLKDQNELIIHLKNNLIAIEKFRKEQEIISEVKQWINLALIFQSEGEDWWWLTKRVFQSALESAKLIMDDDRQHITVTQYLYGRFLSEIEEEWQSALEYLDTARETSKDKAWNASKILGKKQESIFRECCSFIYKILIALVREVGHEDPEFAVKACSEALQRALDAGHEIYIVDALYELGRNHLRAGDVKSSLRKFMKLLAIAKRIPDPKRICNAHMELAFAYKELEDTVNTEKHLRLFEQHATHYGLPKKIAQAHYYTGEHFLNQMKTHEATPHLEEAFKVYNELGFVEETDQARIMTGVSRGQERMKQYFELILMCEKRNHPAVSKLCVWKNTREAFWLIVQRDFAEEHENIEDPSSLWPLLD